MDLLEKERRALITTMVSQLRKKWLNQIEETPLPAKLLSAEKQIEKHKALAWTKASKARDAVDVRISKLKADILFGDVLDAKKRIDKLMAD